MKQANKMQRNDRVCQSCYWWNFKDKVCEKKYFECERRKK